MPMKLFHGQLSPAVLRADDGLFLFGDNFERAGKGGQAVIRDMPNALGIAVKHQPKRDAGAYLSDADMNAFQAELLRAHREILAALRAKRTVYWPADGIGTGLAELPSRAPLCYSNLCYYSRGLFERAGAETYRSLLVCGGRDYGSVPRGQHDPATLKELKARAARQYDDGTRGLERLVGELRADDATLELMEGGARGGDKIGADLAKAAGLIHTQLKADWNQYGRRAGFLRNTDMANRLAARRDQAGAEITVLGFPGGAGTAMMLKISRERGFDVRTFEEPEQTAQATLDV